MFYMQVVVCYCADCEHNFPSWPQNYTELLLRTAAVSIFKVHGLKKYLTHIHALYYSVLFTHTLFICNLLGAFELFCMYSFMQQLHIFI